MASSITRNIRTGILVIAGAVFLIGALYIIGNKRNLFGSTFRISASFHNVNGLMEGNNVRLSGIDVGTVERIDLTSDSTVTVVMVIENNVRKHIRKNAVASVGTDGLMGNKLVNINAVKGDAGIIEEGDILRTLQPIETDEMIRTLNTTNTNLKIITTDLKGITARINSSNTVWSLMMDTAVSQHVKHIIRNVGAITHKTNTMASELGYMVNQVKTGHGTIGTLLTDTSIAYEVKNDLKKFGEAANRITHVSTHLQQFTENIMSSRGMLNELLYDTSLNQQLDTTLLNIKQGALGFSENMEALKHNVFFRRYFKKKEKQDR